MARTISRCLAILYGAMLAACTPMVPPPSTAHEAAVPEGFPSAWYRLAESQRQILHVDPAHSLILIEVRRGGPFARLGHDHVVASHHVNGYVDTAGNRADFFVPLDRLAVDEPQYRAEAGLDTHPTQDDIAGTRHNMLARVLEAERYPFVLIHAEFIDAKRTALRTAITLHGVTRSFEIPVQVDTSGASMTVSGRLAFRQTDFGMVPMSILGGAIQVEDGLVLRFRIRAAPA